MIGKRAESGADELDALEQLGELLDELGAGEMFEPDDLNDCLDWEVPP